MAAPLPAEEPRISLAGSPAGGAAPARHKVCQERAFPKIDSGSGSRLRCKNRNIQSSLFEEFHELQIEIIWEIEYDPVLILFSYLEIFLKEAMMDCSSILMLGNRMSLFEESGSSRRCTCLSRIALVVQANRSAIDPP